RRMGIHELVLLNGRGGLVVAIAGAVGIFVNWSARSAALREWTSLIATRSHRPVDHLRSLSSSSGGVTHQEFKQAHIPCAPCGCQGLGADMDVGEVFEGGQISEYHCPKCGEYWGAVPWPEMI